MELDELKQQWEILHKKLDEQQIINKRLMETAVNKRIKSISSQNWFGVILVIFIIPFVWMMQMNYNSLHTTLFYFAIGMLVCSLIAAVYLSVLFDKAMKTKNTVLEKEKKLIRFRKFNYVSTFISTIAAFVFLIWATISMYENLNAVNMLGISILLFIAIIVFASWISYRYILKINTLHQSITDLKAFEKE